MNNKKRFALIMLCVLSFSMVFGVTMAFAGAPSAADIVSGKGIQSDTGGFSQIASLGITIVNLLMGIGGLIVVAGLIFTGYNFSLSAVNPDKKTKAYAGLIGVVIGGIMIFGAWKWAGALKGEAEKQQSIEIVNTYKV